MLSQLGGEHDAGLPEAFDAINLLTLEVPLQVGDDILTAPQGSHLQVLGERTPHEVRQCGGGLIPNAEDTGTAFGEPTREFRHVRRISGRYDQNIQLAGPPGA
jgi:hypothetical protein